jgi:hypothetical protein
MLNRDIYEEDPKEFHLLNNGVAKVRDADSKEELQTLRFELKTFICEGQYEKGLIRLLRSYLDSLSQPEQPAAWISGFFGSGKSHLVKMLRYLWVDYEFPDGATARGLANLSPEVENLLKELSTQGRRQGGLHAASGTLGSSAKGSVRLALLSIIFKSVGLPEKYPLAQFVLWLKREGIYEELRQRVDAESKKDWGYELRNLAKSTPLAENLLDLKPSLGNSLSDVHQLLKAEHPKVDDISLDEMVQAAHDALGLNGEVPCTLVALDEIQQYIGEDSQKTYDVQEVTQACASEFEGKLMFVATGQTALTGTPELERLTGRFRIQIELSDADVETVTRKTVLKKKASARPKVERVLERNSGEISRHLSDTDFAPKPEDERHIVDDYPLLPTRRRFWERVLRAVDEAGTQSQLRTQLKVVDEAVKQTADNPLGTVVAGDFIYEDLRSDLTRSGVLPGEIDTRIEKLREEDGDEMGARLCALAFLIAKLPREGEADTGLRATPETFADLMVQDLKSGSGTLRKNVEERLDDLVKQGNLMKVEGEYRMQTRESQEWMNEFRSHYRENTRQREQMASLRADELRKAANTALEDVRKIKHGKSNERRAIEVHFTSEAPTPSGEAIPVWVRDEWHTTLNSVEADAKRRGTDSAMIYVFLPKRSADKLDEAIATEKAAQTTIDVKGRVSTQEGREAQQAMQTRKETAAQEKNAALEDVLDGARVFLAGGQEYVDDTVAKAVEDAAHSALQRLYPKFDVADDNRWHRVLNRAGDGDQSALEAVDYSDNPENHPVCEAVLKAVSSTKKGKEVRKDLTSAPHGWPQDAIDASLTLLTLTNHIRARKDGQSVDAQDLTQRGIGTTRFRAETVTISRRDLLDVRGLLRNFVDVTPGKEGEAVPQFLDRVTTLANRVGGPPPLPGQPDTEYVEEVARCSGNEQLAKLHQYKDRFLSDTGDWQTKLNRKQRREPKWSQLRTALDYASELEGAEEIRRQVEAIKKNRSLLDENDPVEPLLSEITELLREQLRSLHAQYEEEYRDRLSMLQASDPWNQLDESDRDDILRRYDLDEVPEIEVGTTEDVIDSLARISLDSWEARLDALPQRFDNALSEAAKRLEPDTVRVRLESRVLHNEEEVNAWLTNARETLLSRLEDGPVQV